MFNIVLVIAMATLLAEEYLVPSEIESTKYGRFRLSKSYYYMIAKGSRFQFLEIYSVPCSYDIDLYTPILPYFKFRLQTLKI